jgi:hypothetical protein
MRGDWRALMSDMDRMRELTPEDLMEVAKKYFTEENRTVGYLVEVESEDGDGEEEIDFREIMMWAQTLPEAEQQALMDKFMTLDDAGRKALAEELWARMKAETEKS